MKTHSSSKADSARRRGRRVAIAACVLVGSAGVAYLVRQPILVAAGQWLDAGQAPQHATYALICPGAAKTRPFVASAMMRYGLIERTVLIPKTVSTPLVDDNLIPSSHELTRRILNARGVADDRIQFLDVRSGSTWTDALALKQFLAARPRATVAVITNDYHTRRTRWVFHRVLGNRSSDVVFVTAPVDEFGPHDWWQCEAGLVTYLSEYCKLVVYWARYGDPVFWSVVVVAVLMGIVVFRYRRTS